MHGKYPFPEATATTQVLMSGAKGGDQAKPLLLSGLVGGLYDFIVASLGWWNENFTSRVVGWGTELADKAKALFQRSIQVDWPSLVWAYCGLEICTIHLFW